MSVIDVVMRPELSLNVTVPLLSRVAVPVVRPAPSSPHRGRADFRAGYGDQFGRRGSRPEQAERDQGGEADPSYATHFHPSSWHDGARIVFADRM